MPQRLDMYITTILSNRLSIVHLRLCSQFQGPLITLSTSRKPLAVAQCSFIIIYLPTILLIDIK